jgi:hypothetical protein
VLDQIVGAGVDRGLLMQVKGLGRRAPILRK